MKIRIMMILFLLSFLLLFACTYRSDSDGQIQPAIAFAQERPTTKNRLFRTTQEELVTSSNAYRTTPAPAAMPDLIPTNITYDAVTAVIGQSIHFDSGIRNLGTLDSEGFNVKWYVNGVQLGHGGHVGIPAHGTDMTYNSQFDWTPAEAGDFKVEFFVDSANTIEESNENNNRTSVNVQIPADTGKSGAFSNSWPEIEGLILQDDVYSFTEGNPYGGQDGDFAGIAKPNVYVNGQNTGGLCLVPSVCNVLLHDALAQIPTGLLKLKVIVPLSISDYDGDVKIAEWDLVSPSGSSSHVVEIACENSVPILNITDAPFLSAWTFPLDSGDSMNAVAYQYAFDHFDPSCAYNNIVILSSGSELKENVQGVKNEYENTYFGSVIAQKNKYSTIFLDFVTDDDLLTMSVEQLFMIDGRVVFISDSAQTYTPASSWGETPVHLGNGDVLFDVYREKAEVDLDGDGNLDRIEYHAGKTIQINDGVYRSTHVDFAQSFAIVDINIHDKHLEILLNPAYRDLDEETEGVPSSWFCWWDGAVIHGFGLKGVLFDGEWGETFQPGTFFDGQGNVQFLTPYNERYGVSGDYWGIFKFDPVEYRFVEIFDD